MNIICDNETLKNEQRWIDAAFGIMDKNKEKCWIDWGRNRGKARIWTRG